MTEHLNSPERCLQLTKEASKWFSWIPGSSGSSTSDGSFHVPGLDSKEETLFDKNEEYRDNMRDLSGYTVGAIGGYLGKGLPWSIGGAYAGEKAGKAMADKIFGKSNMGTPAYFDSRRYLEDLRDNKADRTTDRAFKILNPGVLERNRKFGGANTAIGSLLRGADTAIQSLRNQG